MYIANQRNSILLVSKVLILKEIQRYMSLDLEGGEHSSAEILGIDLTIPCGSVCVLVSWKLELSDNIFLI